MRNKQEQEDEKANRKLHLCNFTLLPLIFMQNEMK